jgi:hypothetical protein
MRTAYIYSAGLTVTWDISGEEEEVQVRPANEKIRHLLLATMHKPNDTAGSTQTNEH